MTPAQAKQADQYKVWSNQYFKKPTQKINPTRLHRKKDPYSFNVGDRVKLAAIKKPFDREYDERYTTETFTITDRRLQGSIPSYSIKDEANDPIIGWFYPQELLRVNVSNNKAYRIEKVIKKRKRNGKEEFFVKFRGYPKKFNAWVSDIDYI